MSFTQEDVFHQFDLFAEMIDVLEEVKKKGDIGAAMKRFDAKIEKLIEKLDQMVGIDSTFEFKEELHAKLAKEIEERRYGFEISSRGQIENYRKLLNSNRN